MHLRFAHPLMGADPITLARVLAVSGRVPARALPLVTAAFAAGVARMPFSWLERAWVAQKRRRMSDPPSPVFIVGHWRSGTTHLYNALSRDPQFAFVPPLATGLPWNFLVLGKWLRPILERAMPDQRFIDRVEVRPDSPQEDEIALASMQPLSFYHGLYLPRRFEESFRRGVFFDRCRAREIERWRRRMTHFVDKLSLLQPGKRLLIKNPVYTARVALLHAMWPQARFLHIYRNPYVVFSSTRNFYRALFRELALQDPPESVDELILESYPRMLAAFEQDKAALSPGQMAEIRFETFEKHPLAELKRIYRELDLGDFERARPHITEYLQCVEGYRKNRYDLSDADAELVGSRWKSATARWGYAPPRTDAALPRRDEAPAQQRSKGSSL